MKKRAPSWLVLMMLIGLVFAGCAPGPVPENPIVEPDDDPTPDAVPWPITVTQSSPVPDPNYWVYILDRTPLLDWADVAEANTYEIQIAPEYGDVSNPNDTGTATVIECSTSSYQVTSPYDWETDWFWRVRAIKADDTVSVWSTPFQFYVSQGAIVVPFPANNGLTDNTMPTLDWNDMAGAVAYELTLATLGDRVAYEVFTVTGLTSSEYTLTAGQAITPGMTRYWFVRAQNDDGEYGTWSMGYALNVTTSDIPVGNLRDSVVTIDKTPELTWNSISGATRYDIYMADSAAGLDTATPVSVAVPSYVVPTPYAFGAHPFWRIKAYNASSVLISTSADFDFVVSTAWHPLGNPNGETIATPRLAWTALRGIAAYDVQVGLDPDFKDVVETAAPDVAYYDAAEVNRGSSRYWRVKARNEDGDATSWSPAFCFTVRWPYTITVVDPAQGATISDSTPLLSWSSVSYSHTYEVWVSDHFPIIATLSRKYLTSSVLPEHQVATALSAGTWYWRVRPKNLDGINGAWSSTFQFVLTP